MTSGFVRVIGRLFRRHTDESTPAQKKGGWHPGQVQAFKNYGGCGLVADARPSSPRPEIFEGMVGFENLCVIARAADNVEAILAELSLSGRHFAVISKDDNDESGQYVSDALNELKTALIPYRTARDMARRP